MAWALCVTIAAASAGNAAVLFDRRRWGWGVVALLAAFVWFMASRNHS